MCPWRSGHHPLPSPCCAPLPAAFGMDPEATMIYLSDRIDETRLAEWTAAND
ncbi:hypothetical protein [Streptomyces sp. NPDC015350]|uniref:hypothetical protein n=1 Tax=Streptomyces sp. NPDC015350 TaxID=3364955 RepID=UPI0036FF32A4